MVYSLRVIAMEKRTDELNFELKKAKSIDGFIVANESEFDEDNFYKLINQLVSESGKRKSKIAADSCISEPYIYNLLQKERKPARDTVIKLSFGLNLSLEITERLLKLSGHSGFYVRHKRDSILKFAIESSLSLFEADELLGKYDYSIMGD
jgi:DNA-binding phage protein